MYAGKLRKGLAFLAVLALTISILGCSTAATPETTEPTEVTYAPTEATAPPTVAPTETTEPVTEATEPATETTAPAEEVLEDPWGLEEKYGIEFFETPITYRVPEHGQEIRFVDQPFTLTLPEEWVDQVDVFVSFGEYFIMKVTSKALIDLYEAWGNRTCKDYVIKIAVVTKEMYSSNGNGYKERVETGIAMVAGETEEFYVVVETNQAHEPDSSALWVRGFLLDNITGDAQAIYDETVGDITCSLEEAAAMITVDPQ